MKIYGYKLLLLLLRVAMYLKRAAVWLWGYIAKALAWVYALWNKTIGFYLYKLWFGVKKKLEKYKIPLDSRLIELIGKRSTLQVVLFVVVLFVMMPQSALYSKDVTQIPGRDTLLYELVGPGDQDFGEVEIIVEEANFAAQPNIETPVWKQGSVGVETPSVVGREIAVEVQDLSSISAGGTAVTKPTILPGNELPEVSDSQKAVTKRSGVTAYTVQPGDVIGAIAEKFDVTVNTILWANDLSFRSYIRPGDELIILQGSGLLHKVARGDTLIKIARKYDSEVDSIIEANRLQKDGSDIVIGEELFVPEGVRPTPRPVFTSRPRSISRVSAPPPSVSAPAGSSYIWPTNVRRITQYYGWRHTGIDIAGPSGSPLYASRSGRVIKSQCGWNGGYGCYIIIDHGGGVQTLYAHASQLYVTVGENVGQGQTIALMGSTGRSTGPHIHFEVRVNGRRQNPLQYAR